MIGKNITPHRTASIIAKKAYLEKGYNSRIPVENAVFVGGDDGLVRVEPCLTRSILHCECRVEVVEVGDGGLVAV